MLSTIVLYFSIYSIREDDKCFLTRTMYYTINKSVGIGQVLS